MNIKRITFFVALFSLSTTALLSGQVGLADCPRMKTTCCCPVSEKTTAPCPVNPESEECDCSLSSQQATVPGIVHFESHKKVSKALPIVSAIGGQLLLQSKTITHDFEPPPLDFEDFQTPYLRAPPQFLSIAA